MCFLVVTNLILRVQMTKMLDILGDYLDLKKMKYCRLDGGMDFRDRQVKTLALAFVLLGSIFVSCRQISTDLIPIQRPRSSC